MDLGNPLHSSTSMGTVLSLVPFTPGFPMDMSHRRRRSNRRRRSMGGALPCLAGVLLGVSFVVPARAAEKVVFKYGALRESVSTQELRDFATQGKPSAGLAGYIRKAGGNPQGVQTTLTQPIRVEARLVDRALNSGIGNLVLDRVGETIHPPAKTASRQALRAAIALSVKGDNQLSLLEIIENYPTQEVQVDGNQLAQAYNQINDLAQQAQRLRDWLSIF
jgi:hypothetical protein